MSVSQLMIGSDRGTNSARVARNMTGTKIRTTSVTARMISTRLFIEA